VSSPLLIERDGPVAVLTINRPDTRNDVTDGGFIDALEAACRDIGADREIAAVVLTGAGSAFSSGGNIKAMHARGGMFAGDPADVREGYRRGVQRIPRSFYELDVPTIAAVNGSAIGAGCDLTLMCDIRIASEKAVFAESFVRVGLIPGDGGAWLLPRALGLSRACEMIFTGDPVDARTALAWGLVSSVVAPEELMPAALRLAHRIAQNPPRILRMAKRLVREGLTTRLETLLELSASYQALAHHTPEHENRLKAILERKPAKPAQGE
jgi:enoyl-CoA hydratase/carnithine racemase